MVDAIRSRGDARGLPAAVALIRPTALTSITLFPRLTSGTEMAAAARRSERDSERLTDRLEPFRRSAVSRGSYGRRGAGADYRGGRRGGIPRGRSALRAAAVSVFGAVW